ncbi:hypothetical protein K3728_14895 [Rhodobacteraceae bacterium M385]|nr:hypothetical protein K3728_14895 [Rhodobacteraceae bacterium M385]
MGQSSAALETAGNELINAGILQLQGGELVMVGGACAGATETVTPAPESLVATMRAIRDNGCVVTEAGADALFLSLGPREEVMGQLQDLDTVNLIHMSRSFSGAVMADRVCDADDTVLESFAAQVEEMLTLPENNQLSFTASRRGARTMFVEWIVSQGCRTPQAGAMAGMGAFGFENTLASVVVPLLDGGMVESGEAYLSVPEPLCAATFAERRAQIEALPPGDAQFE